MVAAPVASVAEACVTASDIERARERLKGVATVTPLIHYPDLSDRCGGPVLVKFEGAQREGSFKFRGAYNRLSQLGEEERRRGVIAWSSGNHAQGVASAARLLGIRAAIVMPTDAPTIKIGNTRALGAEVILYDRRRESREEIARALSAERGSIVVPSFDDPDIIAGQGTIGFEILEQAADLGLAPDRIVVPCGGGGLVAGIATAVRSVRPAASIYAVEPEGHDDTARSLAAGTRLRNSPDAESFCDALLTPEPGELTFPINQALLAGALVVRDAEVRVAIEFAFRRLRLVAEPGGSVALAALLAGKLEAGPCTAIVISGSNIDPALLCEILKEEGRHAEA